MDQSHSDHPGAPDGAGLRAVLADARLAVERRDVADALRVAERVASLAQTLSGAVDAEIAAELEQLHNRLAATGDSATTLPDPWRELHGLLGSLDTVSSDGETADAGSERALFDRLRDVIDSRDVDAARAMILDVQQAAAAAQFAGDDARCSALQELVRHLSALADTSLTLVDPWDAAAAGLEIAARADGQAERCATDDSAAMGEPANGYRFRAIKDAPADEQPAKALLEEAEAAIAARDSSAAESLIPRLRAESQRAARRDDDAAAASLEQLAALLAGTLDLGATLLDPWPDAATALDRADVATRAFAAEADTCGTGAAAVEPAGDSPDLMADAAAESGPLAVPPEDDASAPGSAAEAVDWPTVDDVSADEDEASLETQAVGPQLGDTAVEDARLSADGDDDAPVVHAESVLDAEPVAEPIVDEAEAVDACDHGPPPDEVTADAHGALDPHQPLDPTGGVGAPLDPNQPLDPTGGMGAPLDLNQPLDPTGGGPTELTPEMMQELMGGEPEEDWGSKPLTLSMEKAELLQFMVGDLRSQAEQIEPVLVELRDPMSRDEAGAALRSVAHEMEATSSFFDFSSLKKLVEMLERIGSGVEGVPDENLEELLIRVRGIASLIDQLATALEVGMELTWPLSTFQERVELLLAGRCLHPMIRGWHGGDVERLLELEGVQMGVEDPPKPPTNHDPDGHSGGGTGFTPPAPNAADASRAAEPDVPIVRVPKPQIELMQDRVRQLVLTKNRLLGLARHIRDPRTREEAIEEFATRADELSRLVGELQGSVMQTRLQTVSKMFERYQRTIRDVARLNDKEIELKLEGERTEIDKFLLEDLSDPITQLLRSMAANGIETPTERATLGKPEQGTMTLSASTQGSQIVFRMTDDGRGIDVERARSRLVEFGVASEQRAAAMDDADVLQAQIDPRLEQTDLAPIGDAVRRINASVSVETRAGRGTTLELIVPLTNAVIAAMMVEIRGGRYAIPLEGIVEIVRPTPDAIKGINGRPVLRIREQVIPVIDMRRQLADRGGWSVDGFAVVVDAGGRAAALVVDAILGQQEIVIEPLDDECGSGGPFSGATIREDGGVSLIVDVMRSIRLAERAGGLAPRDDEHEPETEPETERTDEPEAA